MKKNSKFTYSIHENNYSRPVVGTMVVVVSTLSLVAGIIVAISFGAATIDFWTVWRSIFYYDPTRSTDQIIMDIRLPRELGAVLVGAALAISGAIMQGMTRNDLADPGLLGINAGASLLLACVFAAMPGTSYVTVMLASFLGAALGAGLVFGLASLKKGGHSPLRIILAGAAVSAFLAAIGEGIAIYFKLSQDLSFWTAGGVAGTSWNQLMIVSPIVILGIVVAIAMSKQVTILSFGEEIARGLGQNITVTRAILMIIVFILAGAAVSLVGAIAFVGLIIPHIVRFLVGTDYRWIIPCSAIIGSLFLVLADTAARMISAPYEVPIGAVVSIVGVPFFLYLARKGGRKTI